MLILKTFNEVQKVVEANKLKGKLVGFVPTMGALHSGHLSLIEASKKQNYFTICSVFINPTQFNNASDLATYPRTENEDIELLKSINCDAVFMPSADEVYPAEYKTPQVDLKGLDMVMEGAHRPGHFSGVVQVVNRFFEGIEPDYAFFGEKDFQQLAVIQQMVLETKSEVKVIGCPIKRANSGLALSSRNVRLSPEGLKQAELIIRLLKLAKKWYTTQTVNEVKKLIEAEIRKYPFATLEYFEIADAINLREPKTKQEKARAFIVVFIEEVRLIDNLALNY